MPGRGGARDRHNRPWREAMHGRGGCVNTDPRADVAFTCGGNSRIILCNRWRDRENKFRSLVFQAGTLLHEALHIYFFRIIGDTGNLANANCYEQFVFDLNGLAVPGTCPSPIGSEAQCDRLGRVVVGSVNQWKQQLPVPDKFQPSCPPPKRSEAQCKELIELRAHPG
jgi:hypothetical protein